MTKITYMKINKSFSIHVEGHAGYNPGNDIVCSAVSALTYALTETIQQEENKGNIKHMRIDIEDGLADIECKCIPTALERIEMAFYSITNGYALIANQYKDNVMYEEFIDY